MGPDDQMNCGSRCVEVDMGPSGDMWVHKEMGECGSCWMGLRGNIAAGETRERQMWP